MVDLVALEAASYSVILGRTPLSGSCGLTDLVCGPESSLILLLLPAFNKSVVLRLCVNHKQPASPGPTPSCLPVWSHLLGAPPSFSF